MPLTKSGQRSSKAYWKKWNTWRRKCFGGIAITIPGIAIAVPTIMIIPNTDRHRPESHLISATSQVHSGKQNKNALDPFAEVGSKVPKVPSQEMCSTSFGGSQ
jgi:hypothetical protein